MSDGQAELLSQLRAVLHGGNPGDEAFYASWCPPGCTVLELGCGHGRMTAALAHAGATVVGLDVDEEALRLAEAQRAVMDPHVRDRIEYQRGDMRAFALGRRFDRVLIPFHGLYCLLSVEEVTACFRCIAKHVKPDGFVIFDGYNADAFHAQAMERVEEASAAGAELSQRGDVDPWGMIATMGIGESAYEVWEQSEHDAYQQRLVAAYRFLRLPECEEAAVDAIPQRYMLSSEFGPRLRAGGLALVSMHAGFPEGRAVAQGDLANLDAASEGPVEGLLPSVDPTHDDLREEDEDASPWVVIARPHR